MLFIFRRIVVVPEFVDWTNLMGKSTLFFFLIADLFEVDKSVVSRHLANIYNDGELDWNSTVAKYATVRQEGSRQVERQLEYYNLEAIIAVGYCVNS